MQIAVFAMQEAIAHQVKPLGLLLLSYSYLITSILYENMPEPSENRHIDQRLVQLKKMIGFVQKNYASSILLRDIASAGSVCKTVCYELFDRHLRQTPMGYLKCYRLEKAEEMLHNPNLTITEIALSVGFSTPSHFTESFRKHYGVTPGDYRKQIL